MGRFSQAISEGDGISVIPLLTGDVEELAAAAEAAGAEAVAVAPPDVARARTRTDLPVVARGDDLQALADAGADACVLVFEPDAGEGERLEALYALARELGLDCTVGVRSEDGLEEVLERVDPEILLISGELGGDGDELERALELLVDVPVGKLVVAQTRIARRDDVLALERAGVDAVIVEALVAASDFSGTLEELARGKGSGG